MDRLRRFGLLGLVLLALFGLGVVANATEADRWPYPDPDRLAGEYEQFVGQDALLFGTVERVEGSQASILVDHDRGSFQMQVRQLSGRVRPGGIVQVYGRLAPEYVIDAKRTVVVSSAAGSQLFKYAVSAVAVGLFLVAFFRYWRVNIRAGRLEERDRG